jgi:hypothetical protein
MPGVLNPKYIVPEATGGGVGTVDPAQLEAIVAAEIAEVQPAIISAAVSQSAAAVPATIETAFSTKTPAILQQAADAVPAIAEQILVAATPEILQQAAAGAQTKADAAKTAAVIDAVAQVDAILDSKVNASVTAAIPGITTEVQTAIDASIDSKIVTEVQAQMGAAIIAEVDIQIADAQPLIEQNVIIAVNQDMVNTVNTAMDARQPVIVEQVKVALTPEIGAEVDARMPSMVAQVTDATTANLNTLVDDQVVTHYPAIVDQMWIEVDTQVQQQLADSFQAERATIIGQVLNSIGDVDRAEVIIATNRGIKADARHRFSGGGIVAGTTTFNDIGMVFADADVGKPFYVAGAGAGGALLEAVIVSRTDIRTVEISVPAGTTVTSAEYLFGTDDTAAWELLLASFYDYMVTTIVLPYGLSLTDPIAFRNNVKLAGTQTFIPGQTQIGNIAGLVLKPGVKAAGLVHPENASIINAQFERIVIDGADRLHPNVITQYAGGNAVKGSNIFNAPNGNFVATDVGKRLVVYGAGANGGDFVSSIFAVNSPTQVVVDNATDPHPFAVAVTDVGYAYGFYTANGADGVTTAGSTVFNAASASFTAVDVGRAIELTAVANAVWVGDSRGELLCTRIKTVNSPTQVVLETAADIALTGVRWRVGMVHGVYQYANATEQQAGWSFEHVVVRCTSGIGLVTGNRQRGNRLYRTYFYRCRGIGALINSMNNEIDLSGAIQCGGDGVTVMRPGNRFTQFHSLSNNGSGAYVAPGAEGTVLAACHMETNDRNGVLSLAKNVQKIAMKYTSNSQCANGVYSDVAHTRRYATGSVGVTPIGVLESGSQWILAGNGYKPKWGVESAGPTTIRGDGVQYDVSTAPFVTGAVSQNAAFAIAQGSFAIDANSIISLLGGVVFSSQGAVGTKFGASAAEKISFYGSTPIVKPTVSGKAATASMVRNLMAALAGLGLVVNNVT